jgi:hypothetical protein
MAQPVWVLSVDLQAKTATFQTGLADAARSARDSFKQVNQGASEMGESVGRGSLDVRHALGLVDNTIRGAHSMAMVDLIRMFKDSALVMGALPFAMTAAGFALVAEMVVKGVEAYNAYRMAAERLGDETTQMHTSLQDVLNGISDRVLEASKETDDLTGNHLGALNKELTLINHQDMGELRRAFEDIAKTADTTFTQLKASWYQFGIGSDGARHALDAFKTQYDSLLSQHRDKEAAGLLSGTLEQAKHILAIQENIGNVRTMNGEGMGGADGYNKALQWGNELKAAGVGITDKEIQSQRALVEFFTTQVEAQREITAEQSKQYANARIQTANQMSKQGNQTDSKVAEGRARMMQDLYGEYEQKVAIVQQGERETIDATKAGSTERLQAIESAMAREEADGLQSTAFYKELAIQKLEVQREIGQQQAEEAAAMDRERIESNEKVAELELAGEKQKQALIAAVKHVSAQQQAAEDEKNATLEYNLKRQALQNEIEALDQSGQQYRQQLQRLQDQEKQLWQQHENDLAAIREKTEEETNQKLSATYQEFVTSVSGQLTQLIMRHQTLAKTFENLGDQMISSAIKNAIQYVLSNKTRQESDARAAASAGFRVGMEIGGPLAPVIAPVFAAVAFAGAMAFESGGIVPGVGRGDTVPAMLTPGEGVVPRGVMDGLSNIARNGGFDKSQGSTVHLHVRPTYHVQTIDGDGMQAALEKHSGQLVQQFHKVVRSLNR